MPPMPDDPKSNSDMTINSALEPCMSLYHPVPVWGPDGKLAGVVKPMDLAAALRFDSA